MCESSDAMHDQKLADAHVYFSASVHESFD